MKTWGTSLLICGFLSIFGEPLLQGRASAGDRELPFTPDKLKVVTGPPTRIQGGNWCFDAPGQSIPIMVIYSPTKSKVSFGLNNTAANELSMSAILKSKLFTSDEQKVISSMADEARKVPFGTNKSETKTVGRYAVTYNVQGVHRILTLQGAEK
jgi:hypothetical protein